MNINKAPYKVRQDKVHQNKVRQINLAKIKVRHDWS